MIKHVRNIPRNLLKAIVRGYQLIISPHLGASCRYTPTCSEYSIQALTKYGAVKGSILTVFRISRCAPWGKGGYDPPRWFGEPSEDHDQVANPDLLDPDELTAPVSQPNNPEVK